MTLTKTPRGRFVDQKVNKIRWRPSNTKSGKITPTQFITGSWDDETNSITFWSWPSSDVGDNLMDQDQDLENLKAVEPERLASLDHSQGDVNDLQFLNIDHFVSASSDGSVSLIKLSRDNPHYKDNVGWTLNQVCQWKNVHGSNSYKSSCNGISCFGDLIVSAGEDGKIALLNPKQTRQAVRSYQKADSCSLTSVKFIKNDEIAAINMRGQVKLWDLRSTSEEPSKICDLSSDQIGLTCLARHPVQPHILCTGCADGVLAFWDLRKENHPVTLLTTQPQAISEVHFHQQQPDHLFSCSQGGDVLHWNGSNLARSSAASFLNFSNQGLQQSGQGLPTGCVWLNSDAVKHKVETLPVMSKQHLPINSIDILGSSLLIGGDNEAMYLVENVLA